MFVVHRSTHNPILKPHSSYTWEHVATCNGCPVREGNKLYLLYRAIADPDPMIAPDLTQSTIGRVVSLDGVHFQNREQLIVPEHEWERYGCEDPRVTKIGDTYYIFYTALSVYPPQAAGIKVAVAITKDLEKIETKHLVTPFNAKAMTLFPEKVSGRYAVTFTLHSDQPPAKIPIVYADNVEDFWDESFWEDWYNHPEKHHYLKLERNDQDHVEIGAPLLATEHGWLMIYSHIQNYFTSKPIFGVEAVLLDTNDPTQVIGRTNHPFLVPEEMYERYGYINNITFPTGALIHGENLEIYYGGADTTCNLATVNFNDLMRELDPSFQPPIERVSNLPVLSPTNNAWEQRDVFNPAAIDLGGDIHILYRAMSPDNTSTIGYARTRDGITIDERLPDPIYTPRAEFEQKLGKPDGNSGCEDPRATLIDDRIYMCYTAYNGIEAPRVAVTSISSTDFLDKNWSTWSEPELLTPQGIDDKDACLLPAKVHDHYVVLHRVAHHICLDFLETLDFGKEKVRKCVEVMGPRPGMWDGEKVGIAGPPHLTDAGWLLLYHGVSHQGVYRVGAALLDRDQPNVVLARTDAPIFEPELPWELEGEINNVVFPCGSVIRDNVLYIYYGGADKHVGIATADVSWLLSVLKPVATNY